MPAIRRMNRLMRIDWRLALIRLVALVYIAACVAFVLYRFHALLNLKPKTKSEHTTQRIQDRQPARVRDGS